MRQHHPGYQNIEINNAAWDVLPENGNISTEIPALESEEVSAIPLAPEEENQYIDDPVTAGIPDLQQNELEIDQLRAEIRNQRNSRRRSQGLMELQAPTCQLTPLNEFDESLPLFSNAFPYLFPDGKAEFRIPRQRSIQLVDYLLHAVRYHDGRLVFFCFFIFNLLFS